MVSHASVPGSVSMIFTIEGLSGLGLSLHVYPLRLAPNRPCMSLVSLRLVSSIIFGTTLMLNYLGSEHVKSKYIGVPYVCMLAPPLSR